MNINNLYEVQQSLFARSRDKIKPGLERMYNAVSEIGNPHLFCKAVHVAGTNGKGSTSTMIANALLACGERVGLFTSPHVFSFGERFNINGLAVKPEKWLKIYGELEDLCDRHGLTFFEISTLIAFELFRRESCSWVVLETGMGGRFDATNICFPQACVITTIGIDHTAYLGNTLEEITHEKLGIVKEGVPLIISGANEEKVLAQAQNYCFERNSPLSVSNLSRIRNVANSENPPEICLDLHGIYKLAMSGEFQKNNFMLAVTALETLGFGGRANIYESAANTTVSARMQKMSLSGKSLIFDAAHNPQAMENLCASFKKEKPKRPTCAVLGIMSDKDIKGVVRHLISAVDHIVCFTPLTKRAELADYLAQTLRDLGAKSVTVCKSAHAALNAALEKGETVLASGSFYAVSEVMGAANEKESDTEKNEN